MGGQHLYLMVHIGVSDEDVGQLVGVDPPVPHPVALQLTVGLQRSLPLQVHGDFVISVHQSEIIISNFGLQTQYISYDNLKNSYVNRIFLHLKAKGNTNNSIERISS